VGKGLIARLSPRTPVENKSPVPYVARSGTGASLGTYLGGGTTIDRETELQQTRGSGALFGVVDRLAGPFSRVLWHLHADAPGEKCEDCGEQGQRLHVVPDDHPMMRIWNRPNEHFTGMIFRESYAQHLELTGESYWFVVKFLGVPVELWPLRPDRMTPAKHPRDYLVGWWYTDPDGEKIPLLTDEVIQIRKPDPHDPYRGLSPIGALLPELKAASMAAAWNAKFFENSAIPGGIIEYEERLQDHEFEEIVDRWRATHQGTNNAHRVAIVEGGKWVPSGFTHREMLFDALHGMSGDAIREAYGFPKFAQGIVEDVNRASAEASDDFFAKWLIVERLDRTRDALNNRLAPMFGTMAAGLTYAYRSPVDGDVEAAAKVFLTRSQGVQALVTAGFPGPGALEVAGLPAIEGWEKVEPRPAPVGAPPGGNGGAGNKPPAALAPPARGFLERVVSGWRGDTLEGEIVAEVPAELQRVQDDWTRALDALEQTWARDITPAWRDAVIESVEKALEVNDPPRLVLLDFGVDLQPAAVELEQAMQAMELRAEARMRAEAATQGVIFDRTMVTVRNAELWSQTAQAAVALLLSGYAQAAGREALRWWGSGRPAADIADRVKGFLKGLSGRSLRATLGGLLSRAQNAGRLGVLRRAPEARYYATEILDGSTCKPCASIDGKRLPNLDAVLLAYGGDGGYLFCEGRERCRGTFVAKWGDED
jgi:hypothetical protein